MRISKEQVVNHLKYSLYIYIIIYYNLVPYIKFKNIEIF